MMWQFPLPNLNWQGYEPGFYGSFGAKRQHDRHTGVDLYCEAGQTVIAVEDGIVVGIEHFTGPEAASPWWLPTQAILVKGSSGVVLYGELQPVTGLMLGSQVKMGDLLGHVVTVIKEEREFPSRSMLHLELYTSDSTTATWWQLTEEQPQHLLDPTPYLLTSVNKLNNSWRIKLLSSYELRHNFLALMSRTDRNDKCHTLHHLSAVPPKRIQKFAQTLAYSMVWDLYPGYASRQYCAAPRYAGAKQYRKAYRRFLRLGEKICPNLMIEAYHKAKFTEEYLYKQGFFSRYEVAYYNG